MIGWLSAVFGASLLGSLHCAGMCGGFVAFYSGADGSGGRLRLLSHGAYSGGVEELVAVLLPGAPCRLRGLSKPERES